MTNVHTPSFSPSVAAGPEGTGRLSPFVHHLRELAFDGLARMYRRDAGVFAFRLEPELGSFVLKGTSARYTAMSLIGLAGEPEERVRAILGGESPREVCGRILEQTPRWESLGDVAVTLWAASVLAMDESHIALARLLEMAPDKGTYPTVEVAWSLAALCLVGGQGQDDLRRSLAERLMSSLPSDGCIFPHRLGTGGSRSHVACFADLVYPVHALANYHARMGDRRAVSTASRVAQHFCRLQGRGGQWWWHYDVRTGDVIEGYPVYAVHQDAMAPMALFAVQEAGGPDFSEAIARGLAWLESSPELNGRTLLDDEARIIWRKVARREPGKTVRYLRAAASRVHPSIRLSALEHLFPPGAIDREDRPYHLGWVLYAWPQTRVDAWAAHEAAL